MLRQWMPQILLVSFRKIFQAVRFKNPLEIYWDQLSCKDGKIIPKQPMLEKLINTLNPNYSRLKNWTVFSVLTVVSVFIRLPFFFRDYIDRDESTFILMGQSWVDGHLPYTELWDLKPPITFLFFAGIIYVFGKSFIAIRLFGAFLVATTAFFSYKIGETVSSKKIGFWAGILCVILQSMFGSIQGVMSEHLCMVLFMPGLYLLIKSDKYFDYLMGGLLMGLAIMTKLNIAYAVLLLGLYILYFSFKNKNFSKGIFRLLLYGGGIFCIVLLTILPYYLSGQVGVWWKSVILASLEYAGARRNSILSLAPTFLILSGFLFFAWKKNYLDFKNTKNQILLVAILGVLFSFFKSGRINSHYLIQLYPILVTLVAIVAGRIPFFTIFDYRPYVFFLLLLLPVESYLEYGAIFKHKIKNGSFFNGEGITVPNYLKANNLETQNVFFLEYHIGYWPLGATPPTVAATHPSNLCRNELFPYFENTRKTAVEELQYIMEKIRPQIVVTRKNRLIFDEKLEAENRYMNTFLEENYKILTNVDGAEIHQLLKR